MTGQDLKKARLGKKWTQQHAARALGVSQGYLSLLEKGRRSLPSSLVKRLLNTYEMPAVALPLNSSVKKMTANTTANTTEEWARSLGSLGYPGFSYFKGRPTHNPAEVLLVGLNQPDLDSRVAKGLPWLAVRYADMNWEWLVENAKRWDLQNRLGFALTLARQVVERTGPAEKASLLAQLETSLERSRLVREDTFCHDYLTEAEKRWLRQTRSPEAQHWNLLTDLTAEQLIYA